ncbi:ABC transporter permease [Pseudomonas schmalbachii]|uniref:ABC transporter permease n=1 Tax=Pseudomonas schmalbachii TaxID=2816993 RepID=A0ABS3TK65_9PSED|nr:ABC transporter permease [Pseudomonas schmalbachii]MBO3274040.1 ABC transporter permease [Pseudomonas schmalbachii]
MRGEDVCHLCLATVRSHRTRSAMLLLAVGIGVLAVNLLTGLGEGARAYVLGELGLLGRNVLIVLPGRNETTGGMPPVSGTSARDLTRADAAALARLPGVRHVAPVHAGHMEISQGNLRREALTVGTTAAFFAIRKLSLAQGRALPERDSGRVEDVCVLGARLRAELFGSRTALGQWLRAGDRRLRVVGILAASGESLGMDIDQALLIPVASAEALFNRSGLLRVFVETSAQIDSTRERIRALLAERHQGEEDVTLVSQDSLLAGFDRILSALTLALAAIAAISLLVAGLLIMNVTWIAVMQRSAEIGLLKAIGASTAHIRALILGEAALLALLGAAGGLALGECLLWIGRLFSALPLYSPWWARLGAPALALAAALLFAWLPAAHAARLAPVQTLRPARSG